MKALVLYDSTYGNTATIAKAIYKVIAKKYDAVLVPFTDIRLSAFHEVDFLVVGSPTQGGRPTKALEGLLKRLPSESLKNVRVAAFDTRLDVKSQTFLLRLVMNTIHYAAGKIAHILVSKGGKLIAKPQGFIVKDTKGPLPDEEIARAGRWAEKLVLLS
ncbi:MAG TPA: flavodoxin domain-containing protein [Candidatus Saccharibacteria bacterium]|nr:flavodoxin domain-containing protein [Candidatus Saccharibacteria bacterium]HRK93876.1 flavodoxin domain-containing protein [Candidatus Saccharibacteria bacterium]